MAADSSSERSGAARQGARELSFEQSLAELEEIVAQLEAGEKPLDESLALYEKGVAALKRCHAMLDKAEKRIRLLVKGADGGPMLRETGAPAPGKGVGEDEGGAATPSASDTGTPPPARKRSGRPGADAKPAARGNAGPAADAGDASAGGSLFGGQKQDGS
jgi:exodeoxyribonuclease VII small subunit